MNHEEAKQEGYSHYGSYYGIPVYLAEIDNVNGPIVEAKYEFTEGWIYPIAKVEIFLKSILLPNYVPEFCFKIKGEL